MGRLVRGLGQIQLSPTSLPPMGNLNAQLQHGENLLQATSTAIGNGDVTALVAQGITFAQGFQPGGEVGTIVRALAQIGAAAAACSVGGPIGAAAGAIAAAIASLAEAIFGGGGYQGATACPSNADQQLYKSVAQWDMQTGHLGAETTQPQGWTFADYLAFRFPPSTTHRVKDLKKALQWTLIDEIKFNTNAPMNPSADSNGMPDVIATVMALNGSALSSYYDGGDPTAPSTRNILGGSVPAQTLLQTAQPLCTPVFWYWAQPDHIQDCQQNTYFGATDKGNSQRLALWSNDTAPLPGFSSHQIQQAALARKPDPLYWDTRLYTMQASDNFTYFMNLAGLSMMATILGMLAVGAHTVSITQEIILQQKILHDENGHVPNLCRMLVEDYLAMAHRELANAPKAASSSGMSTAAKIALAALAAGAGGVAAYSYKHRISPVDTIKLLGRKL
jgi:hypothetical protein